MGAGLNELLLRVAEPPSFKFPRLPLPRLQGLVEYERKIKKDTYLSNEMTDDTAFCFRETKQREEGRETKRGQLSLPSSIESVDESATHHALKRGEEERK